MDARALVVAGPGVDDDAGRLVHDDDLGIFVDDGDLDARVWLKPQGLTLGEVRNRQLLTGLHPAGTDQHRLVVDQDQPLLDGGRGTAPADAREEADHSVESLPVECHRDGLL